MLHVWIGEYEKYDSVGKPDSYFDTRFKTELTGTDFSRRLIHECSDGSEVLAPGVFKHPTRGNYSSDKLPTGVKNVLLAKYNKEVVIDLLYMGDNCLPFLAEIANEEDITVCTSRYVNFFPPIFTAGEFKGGVYVMNTKQLITNIDDWFYVYAHHEHDVFEVDENDEDPFAWIKDFEDI